MLFPLVHAKSNSLSYSTRAYRSRLDKWGVYKYSYRKRNPSRESPQSGDAAPFGNVDNGGCLDDLRSRATLPPTPEYSEADSKSKLGCRHEALFTPDPRYALNGWMGALTPPITWTFLAGTDVELDAQLSMTAKEPVNARSPMVHTQKEGVGAHSRGPFTYSGYTSEPQLREGPTRGESRTELNDELDARSGYSAATVMGPTTLKAFIFELCQDIYGKALRCKVDYKKWPEISAPLSDLVKTLHSRSAKPVPRIVLGSCTLFI